MIRGAEIMVRFNIRTDDEGGALHDLFAIVPAWFAKAGELDFTSVEDDESTNDLARVRLNNYIHEFTNSNYTYELHVFRTLLNVLNVCKVSFVNVQEREDLLLMNQFAQLCILNGTNFEVFLGGPIIGGFTTKDVIETLEADGYEEEDDNE